MTEIIRYLYFFADKIVEKEKLGVVQFYFGNIIFQLYQGKISVHLITEL